MTFEGQDGSIDTILGVDIFPVIHIVYQMKKYLYR